MFAFVRALRRIVTTFPIFGSAALIFVIGPALGAEPTAAPPSIELVDLRSIDPTIVVDLRYACTRNVAGTALYPVDTPALVRPAVARRLALAQAFLRRQGCGLKIWDAYRPKAAQERLWQLTRKTTYVADPNDGIGSLHTRGVAVDATLVDSHGRELQMPTDFDDFSDAAMIYYRGPDLMIRGNLLMLQRAMARAGFYGLRTEWWHFCAEDWSKYEPVPDLNVALKAAPY